MTISEAYTGSASIGTSEYSLPDASTTLATKVDPGVFSPFIDLNAMTATERYRFRIYETVASAGTKRLVHQEILSGVQSQPVLTVPPLCLINGWDMTLQKLQGTDRTIVWSIRKVG